MLTKLVHLPDDSIKFPNISANHSQTKKDKMYGF